MSIAAGQWHRQLALLIRFRPWRTRRRSSGPTASSPSAIPEALVAERAAAVESWGANHGPGPAGYDRREMGTFEFASRTLGPPASRGSWRADNPRTGGGALPVGSVVVQRPDHAATRSARPGIS